jgi:beta-hydroxyacyl-ACP dehydratase FabZ
MTLTVNQIMNILPHRYPFLLVDKIIEQDDKHIIGLKNVTLNEPFFQGHFPGLPIMPGVLILEAMAQVGAILYLSSFDDPQKYIVLFAGLDEVRFRKQVVPGDQLRLELQVLRLRKSSGKMKGIAYVNGDVVAEAELLSVASLREPV